MKKVWPICSWTPSWRQQILDWDEFDTFPPQCVKDFLQFYDFPAPLLCFTCLWTGKRQLESRWCWWWFTTNLFTCFGPVNNQSCWWYELQTDLFACLWTRDKQRIMMMTFGFFFRRGGWRLYQPEPQRLRWFAVHYFDNVFISDLFCNHHYKDFVFFVIFSWLFRSRRTHALLERKGRWPVWLRSRQDLAWLICEKISKQDWFCWFGKHLKVNFPGGHYHGDTSPEKVIFFIKASPIFSDTRNGQTILYEIKVEGLWMVLLVWTMMLI